MELVEINDSNVDLVLEKFGKRTDARGYIIDMKTRRRIRCRYTLNFIKRKNLGGILPGSDVFIEDSDLAYAGYVMEFLV